MKRVVLECEVNGARVTAEVEPRATLADFLRDARALTSVHIGCGHGVCGACTVLVDGSTRRGCTTLAASVHRRRIETLEGLSEASDPVITGLQRAFLDHGGLQCGFCTPGILLATKELLARQPAPDRAEIREALAGNICRCTGYGPIVDAIAAHVAEQAG